MVVLECCFCFGVTKFVCLELQDIGEHLTTIQLSCCDRGKRCLYEGSAPPGGFPNSWVCYFFWDIKTLHFMIQMYTLFMLPTFVSSFYASWNEKNGASYCTSDLTVLKNNEIHLWDRGFDDDGNQVQSHFHPHLYGMKNFHLIWGFLPHLSGVGTKGRPVRVQTGAFIVKHQQRCVLSFEYVSSICTW